MDHSRKSLLQAEELSALELIPFPNSSEIFLREQGEAASLQSAGLEFRHTRLLQPAGMARCDHNRINIQFGIQFDESALSRFVHLGKAINEDHDAFVP